MCNCRATQKSISEAFVVESTKHRILGKLSSCIVLWWLDKMLVRHYSRVSVELNVPNPQLLGMGNIHWKLK